MIIGGAIIAFTVMGFRGIPALGRKYQVARLQAASARERLAFARLAVAGQERSSDSLRVLTAEWALLRRRSFGATTVNALAAQIGAHLSRVARLANVELISTQIRPDTMARGGFREATGRASVRGDIRGLAALVTALERGPKLFRLHGLTITQSDPIGRPDAPERLSIELVFAVVSIDGAPTINRPEPPLDTSGHRVAGSIVAGNVFRVGRGPALVAFSLQTLDAKPVAAGPVHRPALFVRGIVGPPWQALVEGMPGRNVAVVVKSGDQFGDLRIQSIRRDTVVVRGADTTWRLTVARTWR